MAEDILNFAAEPPSRLLTTSAKSSVDQPEHPADTMRAPEVIPESTVEDFAVGEAPSPKSRTGLYSGLTLLLVVLAGVVGFWLWDTGRRADIAIGDDPIANPGEILQTAEERVRTALENDNVAAADDVACFFAPDGAQPQVLCGPTWLGRSPADEPWLEVSVSYGFDSDIEGRVGEVGEVFATAMADPGTFNRPDGQSPASVPDPTWPTTLPRTERGSLLLDLESAISLVDEEFDRVVAELDPLEVAVDPNASCFFAEGPDLSPGGTPATQNQLYCGPARAEGSNADAIWMRAGVFFDIGETFGTAVLDPERISVQTRTTSLPEGVRLSRPDGEEPIDGEDLDQPPVPTDFVEILEFGVQDPALSGSGRFITTDFELEFDGFARLDRIGTGSDAIIAPPDYELAIARLAPLEGRGNVRGFLLIDGQQRELPSWFTSEEAETLVVTVPTGTQTVELVAENDGRPQTISLDDGTLADGFILAWYRPSPVDLNSSLNTRIELPVGEAILLESNLESVEWGAFDDDREFLDQGRSRLELILDRFDIDRPCCEAQVDDVVFDYTLVNEESGDRYPDARDPETRRGDLWFDVPEDLQQAVLETEIVATFTIDGVLSETDITTITTEISLP